MSTTAAESFQQFHDALQNQRLLDAGSLHKLATHLMKSLSTSTDVQLTNPTSRCAARALMSAADNAGIERLRFESEPTSACDRLRKVLTHALQRLTTPENRHVLMIRDAETWHPLAVCPQTAIVSQASAVARLEAHLQLLVNENAEGPSIVRLTNGSVVPVSESRILDEKSALELMASRVAIEDARACILRLREQVENLQLPNFETEQWDRPVEETQRSRAERVQI